jgi:REP element-mobilizing transposase RayT
MPNHVHGILFFQEDVAAFHETPPRVKKDGTSERMSAISSKPGSLSVVVRLYTGAVTRWAKAHGFHDFAWQSRFHEHIIRNIRELDSIRRYIFNNPARWSLDRFHEGS